MIRKHKIKGNFLLIYITFSTNMSDCLPSIQFSFLEISRNKLNSNYNTRGAFYSWTPWPTSLEMILVSFKFMGSEWRYSDFLWLSSVLWVSSKCRNIEFYSGSSIFSLINRHLERKSRIVTGKRNSIWMNYRVWSR